MSCVHLHARVSSSRISRWLEGAAAIVPDDMKAVVAVSGPGQVMLPLSIIDTGPAFSISSFSVSSFPLLSNFGGPGPSEDKNMFGHPGISVLEYSGSTEGTEQSVRKTLSLRGRSTVPSTPIAEHDKKSSAGTDGGAGSSALELLQDWIVQDAVEELGSQQRRRGTFINHTPRGFELPTSPKKTEFLKSTEESTNSTTETSVGTEERSMTAIASRRSRQASLIAEIVTEPEDSLSTVPIRLDSAESGVILPSTPPEQTISSTTVLHRQETKISPHIQRSGKRRRRQTPFKITVPKNAIVGRYSPLEPLVAHHRRKASESSVGGRASTGGY